MSRMNVGISVVTGPSKRWVALLALALVVCGARTGYAQQEPLSFFKNYFITGDYVVRGTSLWRKGVNGKAVVDIPKLGGADGVTPNADLVAAFLYIQTAEKIQGSGIDHVKFGKTPKTGKPFFANDFGPFYATGSTIPGSGTIAKALNWDAATLPCWSILFPGGGRRLVTYRTDVLRFLPIDPATGKQALNTSFRVSVPDTGIDFGDDEEESRERTDKTGPRAVGVSLVVVYRDSAKPFKSIVIYDGGFTKRAFATMNQTVQGFYDASTGSPVAKSARMTHIVGDDRPFLGAGQARQHDLEQSVQERRRRQVGQLDDQHCLTRPRGFRKYPGRAADAALRLPVVERDCPEHQRAGHRWRRPARRVGNGSAAHRCVRPDDAPPAEPGEMGANPNAKDIFVEIGYLATDGFGTPNAPAITYGGVPKPPHTHLPTKTALNLVGDAFKNAPVPINIHFDVGNRYQDSPYVIPAGLARGGEGIVETACYANNPKCQLPAYPGTVGWKRGYRFLERSDFVGAAVATAADAR